MSLHSFRLRLHHPAAGGVLVALAAAVALVWASSPWRASYDALWGTPLLFVVNDVAMAAFFLLVGLELRRELHNGILRSPRRAALPIVAAAGGMLVPAAIFLALAGGGAAARGWGVPMATDIAFAVGVVALLGRRIPHAARMFLLALAIIDDLGAILVIAIAYSAGIGVAGLAIAALGIAAFIGVRRSGARHAIAYLAPGAAIWYGFWAAGIHPAIAGVGCGLLAPIASVPRAEAALHPWVTFAVTPLFALANAGIALDEIDLAHGAGLIGVLTLALVGGKLVGIVLATELAVRLRLGVLPDGVGRREVVLVGAVAGIGFTMALFVAELAYAGYPHLFAIAKVGILIGSTLAAGLAAVLAHVVRPR